MKRDKKMNYSEITSLKELQAAKKRLSAEIQSREKEVVNDFYRLKLLLSPVYWVQRAFRNWQTLSTTWSFCMRAYRMIQDFWNRKKAARAARRQEKEAAQSAEQSVEQPAEQPVAQPADQPAQTEAL